MTVERTVAACSATGEIDYGYIYTIHNRPVGQSMPSCSARNIPKILGYKFIEIAEVKFVHSDIGKHLKDIPAYEHCWCVGSK